MALRDKQPPPGSSRPEAEHPPSGFRRRASSIDPEEHTAELDKNRLRSLLEMSQHSKVAKLPPPDPPMRGAPIDELLDLDFEEVQSVPSGVREVKPAPLPPPLPHAAWTKPVPRALTLGDRVANFVTLALSFVLVLAIALAVATFVLH